MSVADLPLAPPVEVAQPAKPAPKERGRLVALDVARGFALLGIVLVNVDLFSVPMGILEQAGPYEPGILPLAAWVFMAMFCQGKFYPLFSLLFGIGVVLQRENIATRGGNYTTLGVRRMALLLLFGLTHVVLLWYGDILVFYATAGVALVLVAGWRAATLIRVGTALIVGATLLVGAISLALPAESFGSAIEVLEEAKTLEIGDQPFSEMIGKIDELDRSLADPVYLAGEAKAYREGGFLQALGFRALSWLAVVVSGVIGFWWVVLGLFMLGAGLFKAGLLDPANERYLLRFVSVAMVVGIPLSAVAVVLFKSQDPSRLRDAFAVAGPLLIGPVVALGYLSGVTLIVRHRFFVGATTALAATGRMALTNYLSQSLVLAFVFYHWGLGLYGQLAGHQRMLLVIGLFAFQVAFSRWWLARFRFGPLEWVWRSATYGRRQPMRRLPS